MVVGVGKLTSARVDASELLAEIGPLVGVKGGGSASLARGGGGSNAQALPEAFERAQAWVAERLS